MQPGDILLGLEFNFRAVAAQLVGLLFEDDAVSARGLDLEPRLPLLQLGCLRALLQKQG